MGSFNCCNSTQILPSSEIENLNNTRRSSDPNERDLESQIPVNNLNTKNVDNQEYEITPTKKRNSEDITESVKRASEILLDVTDNAKVLGKISLINILEKMKML